MLYYDVIRITFVCISVFLILLLVLLSIYMFKKNNEYKNDIIKPISVGIFAIIAYSIFLVLKDHNLAVFFDSLFFIATDWLAMFMMLFSIGYTGILKNKKKKITILFASLCTVDSVSLFVNNWTHHMFDLVPMTSSIGIEFWGNDFGPLHYVHLGMCYVEVLITCVVLAYSIKKSADICKNKYVGILITYVVVIILNCVCYSVNLPLDFSVILYGLLAGFICYFSTISYPKKLLLKTLRLVNDTVSDAVIYFDLNGKCIYSNKLAGEIFENNGSFEPFLAEAYREKLEKDNRVEVSVVNLEDSFKINGRERHYSVEYGKEYFNKEKIGYYIKLLDITEGFIAYRKDRFIATHDTFTGTLNRTGFFEAVDNLIEEKGTFGYVMLTSNIRDFKMINELFGEKLGDEVILKQAGLFKTFSHPGSIYARICDDKFALYAKREYFNEKEFLEYMKLMQKVMDKPLYQLRLVVGIYQPQGRIESAQSMYDKALLAATLISNKYNETYAYYDTILMERLLTEKSITEDFEEGLNTRAIQMYLQPIVDRDGKIKGAEALSRWNHKTKGMLLPEEFIEILEKKGQIYQLDTYIWEEAAKFLRKMADDGYDGYYISVNVSVKDFFYTDIYKHFTRLAETYDIKPQNFHIELTEYVLMSDFARAFSLATKLRNEGFGVAIDDFGSGYSSLNMLKDFEASQLKIGMNLLQSSVEVERNRIILESIVDMSEKLGIQVIAEGVETEDQLKLLEKCNCELFQGNYFADAKTVSEFEALLAH